MSLICDSPFTGLVLDEASINELIVSTGVEVSAVLWPTAKLVATEILLAETMASDLPVDVDFEAVLDTLTVARNKAMLKLMPDLIRALMELCGQAEHVTSADVYRARVERIRELFLIG